MNAETSTSRHEQQALLPGTSKGKGKEPLLPSYGATHPSEHQQQERSPSPSTSRPPPSPWTLLLSETPPPWRFYFYLFVIFVLGVSFTAGITLLILAPGYAQRTFDDGMVLSFDKASVVNYTQDSTMYLHVTGSITLQKDAYNLYRRITWLLGNDVHMQDTQLNVAHVSTSNGSQHLIGNIHLPQLTLAKESNLTHFEFTTPFDIRDTHALMRFCKEALASSVVQWHLTGGLPIHPGWLPYQPVIALDKFVEIQGMDGLKHTEMKDMQFVGRHALGGIALKGTVGIFNPSSMLSLTIGNVNFGISLPADDDASQNDDDDVQIALVQALDTQLDGGKMNYFDVKGRTLDLGRTDPRKQARLERFLSTYLHGNTTWVHVRGSRVGPDDDVEIEENGIDKKRMAPLPAWLLDALTQMTLKVPFPGTRQHDLIKSLTMNNIQMEFSMPTMTPLVSGDAIAMLQLPPEMRIAVDVLTISPDVFLYLDEDSLAPFARLKPPRPCRAHTTRDNDAPDGMFKVAAKIVKAPFKVLSEADFEKFLDRVMNKKDAVVYLEGTADAVIDSDLGAALTVRDLPFKGQIHTKGMDGMQHPGPKVTSLELVKGYQDALRVQTNLVLFNPSDISMHLGRVTFQLLYQEHAIGNATLDALSLAPGDNAFVAEGHLFHQDDAPTLLDFISSFLTGDNTNLTISGANGTDSPYLLPLLNQLSFLVPIPPLDKPPLLQKVQMNLLSSTTIAWLENPFGAIDLSILVINATANYRDKHIGTMFANFSDGGRGWEGPVVIPGSDDSVGDDDGGTPLPALSVATPRIPVMLAATPDLEAIAKALGGKLDIDVNSFVHIQVDQFALNNLRYDRKNITAIVRKAF